MRPLRLVALVLAAACAHGSPRLDVRGLESGLDAFLLAHPRPDAQAIRADELSRTASASYHVVQVRGSERPHRHATHDLTVLVLRGHGTLHRAGSTTALAAGDIVVVPRDAVHWFASAPGLEAIALVVFSPPLEAPDVVPATNGVDSPTPDR